MARVRSATDDATLVARAKIRVLSVAMDRPMINAQGSLLISAHPHDAKVAS